MSPTTTRHAEPDQICADAIDLARSAAEEAGPGQVGAHLGTETDSDRVVTHLFACLSRSYVGWRWAVTVARAARSKHVTVSESLLLPGPDSLVAPDWVPWTERIRPGDLKVGDLMPASADDERLIPVVAIDGAEGLLDWDESDAWGLGGDLLRGDLGDGDLSGADLLRGDQSGSEPADDELTGGEPAGGEPAGGGAAAGAGRPAARARRSAGPARRSRRRAETGLRPTRVLSAIGRDETAVRWYTGDHGPGAALANAAPGHCLTCGFLVRLNGPLGRVFGVCANEFAPDDGRVVSVDHGCGAHSDAGTSADSNLGTAVPAVDELGYDMMTAGAALPESVLETLDHELL
ncbi:MAG TPA: DUF3027 domain-containing protein [Streptosporangiaceae bacterium]|nr:DUF3027 domain-containing protein [Streptosporangiaceae bacterium]